jgi:type IV pilus assembly protein PilN
MIKVNLLATTPGAAPAREWLPRDQRSALMGLGMLMVTALGVGGWWYYQHHQGNVLNARIAAAEAELVRLNEAAKVVDLMTARKNELSERVGLIDRLRAAKRAPVSLLETVSRSLPEGLWLLEMKQSGTSVQIDGRATSLTAVTDFTERLQNSGFFQKPVEILTTSTEAIDDATVVKFSVKADAIAVQPPAGTAAAPASTGTVASVATPHPGA